ncbi:hypothetical protein SLEP1_g12124 [Rubroshorea leprosula]|nr:hypothetical protein SLEP1_g12124 [Rubroshorea leprosula]
MTNCCSLAGGLPERLLFSRIKILIFGSRQMDSGKLPVSVFSDNRQNCRERNLAMEEGMPPEIWCLNVVGIGPVSLFNPRKRSRCWRKARFPSEGDKVPNIHVSIGKGELAKLPGRVTLMTQPEEISHPTPSQLQQSVEEFHDFSSPEGSEVILALNPSNAAFMPAWHVSPEAGGAKESDNKAGLGE